METTTLPRNAAATAADTGRIAAPRLTRAVAGLIMLCILLQALLAGGFLAGRIPLAVHAGIGHTLGLLGFIILLAGLVGRRSAREPASTLAARITLFVAIAVTIGAGTIAHTGTRDLLMLHIPLAIFAMGIADGLRTAGRRAA
ncbi:MAG TPA: hypothetical protein VF158_06825 [Longimicrobiales bacterium]